MVYLLKSNVWVQWQIALVLKGFALRLLCILSALRMCLSEINLWHLNLGLVLHYGSALRRWFPSVSVSDCSTLFITQPCNPVGECYLPAGGDWAAHPTAEHTGGWVPQRWGFACKEHSALISTEAFKCFQMLLCFEKQTYSDTWYYFPDLNVTCWYRIRKNCSGLLSINQAVQVLNVLI